MIPQDQGANGQAESLLKLRDIIVNPCVGRPVEEERHDQFIREGEKPPFSKKTKKGLLQAAQSCYMRVDLGRKLHFPEVIRTS